MDNIHATTASGGLRERQKQKQQQQQQQTKQGGKNDATRIGPTFGLPYDQSWPSMVKLHNEMILDDIQRVFSQTFCDQWLLKKKKKLENSKKISSEQIQDVLLQLMRKNQQRYRDVNCEEILASLEDKHRLQSFNEHVVVGINNITRCLEKKQRFSLVMVCRSAQPSLMTQEIMCQCLLYDIPACAVSNLSGTIAPILDLKSVLAIAFKLVEQNPLASFIDFVTDKIPEQTSWARLWKMSKNESIGKTSISKDSNLPMAGKKRPAAESQEKNFQELNIEWKSIKLKKKKENTRKKEKKEKKVS